MEDRLSRSAVALRLLLPFALGYFLSYLFRVVNAVLAPDLVAELGLGPDDLGLLTASYFVTFAAAQLPLGILLDRYGPRKIEAGLLLFAALGAALFALGETRAELIVGRGLIGFGVSACLMAAFKAFTHWLRPLQLPMANGLIMAAGGLGALSATTPVQAALAFTDWRGVFMLLAGVTVVCAGVVFALVPDYRSTEGEQSLSTQLAGVGHVFRDRFFWGIAPLTMLSQASFISIQSLWAGPWLQDVGGLSRDDAADLLLLIAAAMVTGFLLIGSLTARLGRLGVRPVQVAGTGMLLFILVQVAIVLVPPDAWLVPAWLAFGFFGTTGIVQYAVLSQHFPRHLGGRVNTAINLLVFVAAFLLQWLSGVVIDLWPQAEPGHYAVASYQAALALLALLQATAFAWFVFSGTASGRR